MWSRREEATGQRTDASVVSTQRRSSVVYHHFYSLTASSGRTSNDQGARVIMGWATHHIKKLLQGETVTFRPRGSSMSGLIESGQLCTVAPVDPKTLRKGDIVLCKVHGKQYLHLIKAKQCGSFQIGNNRGHINGWTGSRSIYGKLIKVEP